MQSYAALEKGALSMMMAIKSFSQQETNIIVAVFFFFLVHLTMDQVISEFHV